MLKRLKEIRDELGLTQEEFAGKIKLGQSTYAMIEVGKRTLNDRHIALICREFNVNEEWLRVGEGAMFKAESELLELLGEKIGELDEIDKKILTEYIKLSPERRTEIKKFIKNMIT